MNPETIFENQRSEYQRMQESPHNIVFLDVDGVLNTDSTSDRSPMNYVGIEQGKVRILHTILEQNDAILVLTTTWKRTWSRSLPEMTMDKDCVYMVTKFAEENVFACDKTDDDGYDRGHGIARWLQKHPHKGWIVLDDEKFDDYRDYGIFPHLIQTSFAPNGGLKEKHIRAASVLFKKQSGGKPGTEPKTPSYATENGQTWKQRHYGKI